MCKKKDGKRKGRKCLIVLISVVLAIGVIIGGIAIANAIVEKGLEKYANTFERVEYTNQLKPELDDGYWTFTADNDLKVLQFTDVHIGGGSFSKNKDMWALNAVATMIKAQKPDLVIITGDIAYPVPFSSGSFNNLPATKVFATMMENLGVYWTFAYGNHDTEAYSYYTRKQLTEFYENNIKDGNFKYCLFQGGKDANDEFGYGNAIIKVKNSAGLTTQALVLLDSHSYIDGDYFGFLWKYDNLHQSQVDWYVKEMDKIKADNVAKGGADEYVKNMAFFHIPLVEFRDAYKSLTQDGESADVKWIHKNEGRVESDATKNGVRTYSVYCGMGEDNFFEEGLTHGLKAVYSGHDHYNNFAMEYKGIRLGYGYSVDYLAYIGIWKEKIQRGCTVITVKPTGEYEAEYSNYYDEIYEKVNSLADKKYY